MLCWASAMLVTGRRELFAAQTSVMMQALHRCSVLCVHSLRSRRAAGRGRPDPVDGAAHAAAGAGA